MKTLLEEVWNEEETVVETYATNNLSVSCLSMQCEGTGCTYKSSNTESGLFCVWVPLN